MDDVLKAGPLILWSLLFFLILIVAREVGAFLRGRVAPSAQEDESTKDGYVLSGVLGLLALLVAFTFSLSVDRFEQRRALVVSEANALDTFRLRTDLLEGGDRVRQRLETYVALRLELGRDPDRFGHARQAQLTAAQALLWKEAVRSIPDPSGPLAATVLDPLNEAFDTATARAQENRTRIPNSVLLALFGYAMAAALCVGFAANSARLRTVSYMLFALLTLSVTLILDLDRSRVGSIQVPQTAIEEVLTALRRQ